MHDLLMMLGDSYFVADCNARPLGVEAIKRTASEGILTPTMSGAMPAKLFR